MSIATRLLPAILFVSAILGTSETQAQTSVPLYTTSYSVQVQWYFWRSGGTYWSTEYETDDLGDAELIFVLMEAALENGTLCEALNCNWTTWIPVDVRLKTHYHWNLFQAPNIHAKAAKPVYQTPSNL
ncbi:MAG: hypothetical protein AAGG48_10855 [Planctomycetota bacterium]